MKIPFINTTEIRVRYGETDQMGYCYYGNYAQYFEVGRVETLRSLGMSYKSLEENGIMLPVLDFSINYNKPALYDDLLTIETTIVKIEGALRWVIKSNLEYIFFLSDALDTIHSQDTFLRSSPITGVSIFGKMRVHFY
jgi:acyl-CoA thioester hydrolase